MADDVQPADAVDGLDLGGTADAARDAAESAPSATESDATADSGDDGSASDDGTSLADALLSTEPDLSPAEVRERLDVDNSAAHAFIGVRKVLAKLIPSTGDADEGMPAIGNFGLAGYFRVTENREESSTSDDGRDEAAFGGEDDAA